MGGTADDREHREKRSRRKGLTDYWTSTEIGAFLFYNIRFGCRKDISAQAISDITLSSAIIGHSKKARRTKNITTDREEIKPLI